MRWVRSLLCSFVVASGLTAVAASDAPEAVPEPTAWGVPGASASEAPREPFDDDDGDDDGDDIARVSVDDERYGDEDIEPDPEVVPVRHLAPSGRPPVPSKTKPKKPPKKRGGCPADMVRVNDSCIDRYEAPNRRGARPLVMQDALEAEAWCTARRKRLCGEDEWIAACEGQSKRKYPYGDEHEEGACNDNRTWRQVREDVLASWPSPEAKRHTRELYQASPSGAKRKCKSEDGVFDMVGNVEEWVTRPHAGSARKILIGCYWSGCYGGGKPTCRSTNGAHGPAFRFYETGFRCCKDAAGKKATKK